MFYATWNEEAVSCLRFENPARMLERKMASHDVNHLLVRMAVPDAYQPFFIVWRTSIMLGL
jgi:hypothetical protein